MEGSLGAENTLGMENALGMFAAFGLIILLVVIVIYVAVGILLNKLNKQINGKGTPMAWIPIANIYLLGKLTVNKIVGWILVACALLTSTYTTTINGVSTTHTILPAGISSVLSIVYSLAVIGLIIYAIVKYNQLKKTNTQPAQAVQPEPAQTPVQPAQAVQPEPAQTPVQPAQAVQPEPAQTPVQPAQTVQPEPAQTPTQTGQDQNNLQ